MAKHIIDVNLPYRFSLWAGSEYIHARDIDDEWTDTQIWEYAKDNGLTIVTKDADFSDRLMVSQPPPRVIHVRLGNMKMNELHNALDRVWNDVCELSDQNKLVRIYEHRVECVD